MSIVYGIWADDARLPYYGSTTKTLAQRKRHHKADYNLWKEGLRGNCTSFDLFDAVGFDACQFEIVEQLPEDTSKEDMLWRERWYIENRPCINKCIPIRTDEENKEYQRKYSETHKQKLDEYRRQYYETGKEERNERKRQRYARKKAERIEAFKALLKTDA